MRSHAVVNLNVIAILSFQLSFKVFFFCSIKIVQHTSKDIVQVKIKISNIGSQIYMHVSRLLIW